MTHPSLHFLFISSNAQKLMKTGCANLCSNAVTNRAAQRIGKARCSETPTFVIGFSMSQHDRHLVACRLLSHLVHQSHNWEGGDSTSPAWLFLKRKQKIHTLHFTSHLVNPLARLIFPKSQALPWGLLQPCPERRVPRVPVRQWVRKSRNRFKIFSRQLLTCSWLLNYFKEGQETSSLHIFRRSSTA